MKTKQQKSSQHNCPYLKSEDCGRPDKMMNGICNCDLYIHCFSYKCLKDLEEEKKDGKQDS